jgi:SOS-response transcriptional repressor LexA
MICLLIQHRGPTRLDPAPETVDPRVEPMTELPLLGRVSAGHPLEAIEDRRRPRDTEAPVPNL